MLARLASFNHNSFAKDSKLRPFTLSRMGYTYSPESGGVFCSCCKFQVTDLNASTETLTAKHEQFNVGCEFSKVTNIPSVDDFLQLKGGPHFHFAFDSQLNKISNEKKTAKTASDDDTDCGNLCQTNQAAITFEDYKKALTVTSPELIKTIDSIEERAKKRFDDGVDSGSGATVTAKHPGLANREERVRTFRGQDHKYSRSIYPDIIKQLVDAGLYYVGPTDNVRCFFCDGGLKNFSPDDNPFDEHQKWFKECKYIKYLVEKRNSTPVLQRDDVDNNRPGRVPTATTNLQTLNPTPGVDFERPVRVLEPREIKARLETPPILKLLEMGYQKDNIRQAIERRFATIGDDYVSIADLVSDILSAQGSAILPPQNRALESTRIENGVSNPRPQPQLHVAATASADSTSNDDGIDGARLTSSGTEAPDIAEKDVISKLKNKNIDDEELRNLWRIYEQHTATLTCQVCFQNQISTVFLPCGHYVCCDTCTPKLANCCMCRSLIRGTVKALRSLSPKHD